MVFAQIERSIDAPCELAEKPKTRPVIEIVPVEIELLQVWEPPLAPLCVGHVDPRGSFRVGRIGRRWDLEGFEVVRREGKTLEVWQGALEVKDLSIERRSARNLVKQAKARTHRGQGQQRCRQVELSKPAERRQSFRRWRWRSDAVQTMQVGFDGG
jgi:hypothetical protein